MSRRFVPVLALVALLVLASDAAATVGGPCTVEIGGENIGPREVGAFSEPILVSSERPVSVTMSSEQELDRLEVEMELSGFRWTVHERPSTGASWASEVPVDDYSAYGLGIYKVVASSSGDGFTCEGAALIEIAGDDELSALTTPAGLIGLALVLIGAFGVLAIAVRVGRSKTSPVFCGLLGAVLGIGVVVLLQQFAILYPTIWVTVIVVGAGLVVGLALGIFGVTGSEGDARSSPVRT
jgi:hypothetical protein